MKDNIGFMVLSFFSEKTMKTIKGFTLLELLIVLFILGLIAGLTLPRLTQVYQTLQVSYQRDDAVAQINRLGFHAFSHSLAFVLSHENRESGLNNAPIELAEGWSIVTEKPIIYRANGVCEGGRLWLRHITGQWAIQLSPPFCQVQFV
jgi:prepilin-type N-terminal cleavage/methylation domain-containing protein